MGRYVWAMGKVQDWFGELCANEKRGFRALECVVAIARYDGGFKEAGALGGRMGR